MRWNSAEVPLLLYPEPNLDLRATEKMKLFKNLLIPLFIVTLIIGLWTLRSHNQKGVVQQNKDVVEINTNAFIGKTALEATQSNSKVEISGSGENAFVTSINGRTADSKKHEFWELDANGSQTQVGAGSYIIKNNDKIEWKISTY